MKVLHIVSGDLKGGAARGAYWLHLGLKNKGVDSKILTNSRTTLDDDSIITILQSKKDKLFNLIRSYSDRFLTIFYPKRKSVIFSSGLCGINFTKIKAYKEADIIHLHWINGGFISIKSLHKIDKPIVWTMRDMWPLTGGCHYSMECDRYISGCGDCYQLNSNRTYDLSKFIVNRKKKYFPRNMRLVAISNWLYSIAKKSSIFKNHNIEVIFNNINTAEFSYLDKKISRNVLNIKTNKKIILCGATNLRDFYKGFNKYIEAIKQLDNRKYFLCFFGKLDSAIVDNLGFEYKSFGYLNDNIALRLVYASADVFVAPSMMDAFAKTIVESMSCGTPVVCFNATGPKDIVEHQKNGYLAKAFDSNDLACGIEWVLHTEKYDTLCHNARLKAVEEFDSTIIADKYIALYKEILNDKNQ